jgi:hypothetical protein
MVETGDGHCAGYLPLLIQSFAAALAAGEAQVDDAAVGIE